MPKVSRARRAELQRAARQIRRHGQRCGWPTEQIMETIRRQLPEILPLEAWRLAFGWSRSEALRGIAELYLNAGLYVPRISEPMLCRWEHGAHPPSREYLDVLCRLYRTRPDRLGVGADYGPPPNTVVSTWYPPATIAELAGLGHREGIAITNGSASNEQPPDGHLAALRESVQLTLNTEGPAGGPRTIDQLTQAVDYYALHYSKQPLLLLFREVQHTRRLAAGILDQLQGVTGRPRREQHQRDLWQLAGRLSGLLGNAAFHLSDHYAAAAHLEAGHQLATRSGDAAMVAWTRGAQSMLAHHQGRLTDAVRLAQDGVAAAPTPLIRAQVLAWGQLRALAQLGRHTDAHRVRDQALRELEADPLGSTPGRFGFGESELRLHFAEAALALDYPTQATLHAHASLDAGDYGLGGWAAAELTIALAEAHPAAQPRTFDQAAQRGLAVLDRVPPDRLRETTRKRLAALRHALADISLPVADDYRERHRLLPAAPPLPRTGSTG